MINRISDPEFPFGLNPYLGFKLVDIEDSLCLRLQENAMDHHGHRELVRHRQGPRRREERGLTLIE